MKSFREAVESEPDDCDDPIYMRKNIVAYASEIHDLGDEAFLAIRFDDDCKNLAEFGVYEFCRSGYSPRKPEEDMYRIVFTGCGPSIGLRELRHTYWGQEGYLFYVDGKLVSKAFEILQKWFDVLKVGPPEPENAVEPKQE